MKTGNKIASFVLSFLFIFAFSLTASAQDQAWSVDQEHSIARLSLGAGAQSLEAGVARVDGTAVLDASHPTGARLNLTIRPNDPQAPQYSQITFRSKRSWLNQDGSLSVAGDLTVTRIVRPVQADANEGYHGAEFGLPIAYMNTNEVTLVIPDVKSARNQGRQTRVLASTTVYREDFPLLQTALQSGDWPNSLVEDRQSAAPSTIGEGYAGFESTGTAVFTATNSVPVGNGEGYNGFEPATAPDTNKATIALDLKLNRPVTDGSIALSAGN